MLKDIKITRTDTLDSKIKELIKELDEELRGHYGDAQDSYTPHNDVSKGFSAILIEQNEEPIGCGAFKQYNETSGELKRIFIKHKARGQGISKVLVKALEEWMLEKNLSIAVLETGNKQIEALGLYEKLGYQRMPNYGVYVGMEATSICMKKDLREM
jgi:putative acetyltransferase